jgi:hypothetical protein
LTALAQLGTLRLRSSRCFISLFDKTHQYIIAEATPTLSLQNDDVHDEGDRLWYGSSILPRHAGPCSLLVEQHVGATEEGGQHSDLVTVISDLTTEIGLGQTDIMCKVPTPRFYAGVALKSPRGAIIGTYCIMDERPRAALEVKEMKFLRDMAVTVMSNLIHARTREEYRQGERMIRGIGSFVEGRGTLRNWRAMPGYDEVSYEPSRAGYGGEGQLDERQQALSIRNDSNPGETHLDLCKESVGVRGEVTQECSCYACTGATSNAALPSRPVKIRNDSNTLRSNHNPSTGDSAPTSDPDPITCQGSRLPHCDHGETQLNPTERMFSRAVHIVRECLEVEGVVLYDVSSNNMLVHQSSSSSSGTDGSSSDGTSEHIVHGYECDSVSRSRKVQKLCPVIAFSDSRESSVNDEKSSKPHMEFPESVLASLLQRYPHGHIFHIDSNGHLASGSLEVGSHDSFKEPSIEHNNAKGSDATERLKLGKKSRTCRLQEALVLSRIFPGARSISLIPLWDSHKEKWHAGGLVWTKQSKRAFTTHGHLSFLKAMGSTIMTEHARLDALASERAKVDLLGSISHELRSPLHGILGCVELLEGSSQTAFQTEMLDSIETCGRTLLETIEQVRPNLQVQLTHR